MSSIISGLMVVMSRSMALLALLGISTVVAFIPSSQRVGGLKTARLSLARTTAPISPRMSLQVSRGSSAATVICWAATANANTTTS